MKTPETGGRGLEAGKISKGRRLGNIRRKINREMLFARAEFSSRLWRVGFFGNIVMEINTTSLRLAGGFSSGDVPTSSILDVVL